MPTKNHYYCLMLAGGMGKRLWPCSREEMPKQFLDFFGSGKTQLQQTYSRFLKLMPKENIFVSTNRDYINLVKEQLPEVDESRLLAEPVNRNTAPSVAWATHRISRIDPEACIVVTPTDQMVMDEDQFDADVEEGLDFVSRHDRLLTMGVMPTRPEPGYGYIQIGEHSGEDDIFKVKAFTEKPEREFARLFMESGEWYWNTGLFLANVAYLRRCLYELLPVVLRALDKVNPDWTIDVENQYMWEHFSSYPNVSLDYGILERSDNIYVLKCHFGWADIGTWHGIYETESNGVGDNVTLASEVMFDNSRGNIVKLPEGRLAVVSGLDGFIVAEEGNVLLICPKEDSSALVKKLANEVKMRKGEHYA